MKINPNTNSLTIPKQRIPKSKRWRVVVLLCILFAFFGIIVSLFSGGNGSASSAAAKIPPQKAFNVQDLCNRIAKDTVFIVKDVFYDKSDSSLKIALKLRKDDFYNTLYFNKTYSIDSIPNVDGVVLYKYQKGKLLKDSNYGPELMRDSKRAGVLMEKFREKYCLGDECCEPVKEYLKDMMNDPDSFESDKMWIQWKADSTFTVTMTYRGKNAFGGMVLNKCSADVDMAGNVSDFQQLE